MSNEKEGLYNSSRLKLMDLIKVTASKFIIPKDLNDEKIFFTIRTTFCKWKMFWKK